MKKSIRPSGQKTLFQTWNKQTINKNSGNQNSKRLFETWGAMNTCTTKKSQNANRGNENSFEGLINIEDDDDNELLAAINEIEKCENAKNNHDVGNLSFSASTNDDGCEIIPGFDCSAGNTWIYPTNYPIREYQFDIVQKALFHNTLVTLPTGLGKTFIAAVVMYNFYRWYPQGKIIFMAPTKPLVAQQIDACYNIMGIPRQDTAEMTGNMAPTKREHAWKEKRVFFLTPQVFQNDLSRGSCRADDVVCLVFDEAHKALGNHSYCQVVREVLGYTQNFRVLALSATPGDGIKAVQQVISNLLVSNIELRSEDSIDIKPYTHQRQVEKIVVKLGDELEFFKTKFLRVLCLVVNRLFSSQALWVRDAERVNKCMLLAAREQFRKKCHAGQQPRHLVGPIEGDFAVAISLYHAYDLLMQHGLLPFYNFIKGIVDGSKGTSRAKTELTRNPDFVGILDDLRDQIEPDEYRENASGPDVNPSFIGHPKLVKLRDIILEHFRSWENAAHVRSDKGSRVMIFSQFRDSVQEISRMLSEHKPLVKVMSFIGQQSKGNTSKGLTQKEQLEVIRQFRNGGYNTLVATCVGEEGLDIGEVDLIVCFDASASPIRLVQRMGRKGRKRDGRIIVLVTEGKEEQIYQRSQRNKSNIHKTILESARTLDLYIENPRMVPKNIKPVCQKMFIAVEAKTPKNKSKSTKTARKSADGNIKKLFSACSEKGFLSPQELRYWNDNFKLPHYEAGLTPSKTTLMRPRAPQATVKPALSLTEWTAWQTPLQQVHFVNHSKRSRHFTEILEFCDFRRDCGDDDDSYDLEMQSFLNREDILQPGEVEATACVPEARKKTSREENGKKEDVLVSDDDRETSRTNTDSYNVAKKKNTSNNKTSKKDSGRKTKSTDFDLDTDNDDAEEASNAGEKDGKKNRKKEGRSNIARGENETCRKKAFTDFDSDIDDDFEDVLMIAPEKATKSDHAQHSHSPKNLESECGNSLKNNQSRSGLKTLTKNQSESNHCLTAEKIRSGNSGTELPQERNDDVFSSDEDLSDLLHVPSSQRPRKVTHGPIRGGLKPEGLAAEVLPEAPSLDTLKDLSVQNVSEDSTGDNLQEGESDQDFFPSMFTETPKTNKDKVFGFGLVCDARHEKKEDDGADFDFCQRNSFFDDGDDGIDRALCNVETPCVFDDDDYDTKSKSEKNIKKTSNIRDFSPGNLCFEAQNTDSKKYNIHTPLLFDDDMFENVGEKNYTKQMHKPQRENHFSFTPKMVYSESENMDKKKHDVQTPRLFDDKEFENETSEKQIIESYHTNKRLTPRCLYSEVHDLGSQKNQCGKRIDEKLTKSTLSRKPLLEHSLDLNKSTKLQSGVNGTSLSKIRSFSFSKPDTKSSKSLQDLTSESRDKNLDIVNEYDNDVVAPSPHRVKSRTSFFGKNDKTRSFRRKSLSMKSTCSEKSGDSEISVCQNERGMLKSKSGGIKDDMKREMLKSSLIDNDSLFGGEEKNEERAARVDQTLEATSLLGKNRNKLAIKVSPKGVEGVERFSHETKRDKYLSTLNNSPPVQKTSFFAKDQDKVEFKTQLLKSVCKSGDSHFHHELNNDEEMDRVCLSATVKSNSSYSCKERNNICLQDEGGSKENVHKDEILPKKSLFRNPTHLTNRKSSGGVKTCSSNKKVSKVECRVELCESVEDSPLVTKTKGNMRSKTLRQRLLQSDDERGDESSDNDGEYGEENQIAKESEDDFNHESSMVYTKGCRKVHEISDSDDDEFEKPCKVKRKRKLPVQEQFKVKNAKKRRALLDDFLDDEAEVSGDEANETHGSFYDEDDMEDSFIDDRTQLTQRSPLTAMKQKKKDTSMNMMDIYRISLLTPRRKQLRFQTPAFHRYKNRYKMVYDKGPPQNTFTSPADDDSHLNVSMETEESNEETTVEELGVADSFSPQESQIVVRKNRRGKRRVLAESYFTSPEAAESEGETKLSERKTMISKQIKGPGPIGGKDVKNIESIHSKNSNSLVADDVVFKHPGNTVPVSANRELHGTARDSKGYPQDNGNVDEILAALNDSDDESLIMEINALPSLATAFEENTAGNATKNTSQTHLRNSSRKILEYSSNNFHHAKINTNSSKFDRTFGNTNYTNENTNHDRNNEISSSCKKPNLSRSLQLHSNKRNFCGTGQSSCISSSIISEGEPNSRNESHLRNREYNETESERKDNERLMVGPSTSNMPQTMIGLSSGQKNKLAKTSNCGEGVKTNLNSNLNDTSFASKNNNFARFDDSAKLDCNARTTKAKTNGSQCTSGTGDKSTNVSPVFPPLATTRSSRDTTSYAHVCPEKTSGEGSSSEHAKIDTSKAPSKALSPALTATQRDKNKLTILVGSKEVSNCQIVSFLRRKHNIKTVVSQITGCDYIVSSRMAVERKLASDISSQANHRKLITRVRELCDLYDRPCIVIERDRVKTGETQAKCQVRSKYFDRLLACFAQTHIKVLFSDGQEATSDILSSLAHVEEKKDRAIIYPLPLSKEKEQIVKFLSSIPRTSYITAISLCYHNKTLQDIINSSAEELVKRVKTLSLKRANDILKFLQHGFSSDMVDCSNT